MTALLEQEEEFVISWPELRTDQPPRCNAVTQVDVSFMGGSSLGSTWYTIDYERSELILNTKDSALTSLKQD